MELAVVFVDEEYGLMCRKFTGILKEDDYVEFDDYIFGWYGMHRSTLGTLTEDKVFCCDTLLSISKARAVLVDNYSDKILDLKEEIDYYSKLKDKIAKQEVMFV